MADRLPENPRQWPDDPFRLLGVEPPVSEQDLKRAYTRLIRRFKPEHHPEQFRRVREAYEAALQRARWFGYFSGPEPDPEPAPVSPPIQASEPAPVSDTLPAGDAESGPTPKVERDLESPHRPVIIDPFEEAWALGVVGQRAEAYSRLVDLTVDRPNSPEAAIRLYWLLAIDPGLDSNRTRHDWLAAALSRSGLTGPSRALYTRELAADPESALFGPYVDLLSVAGAAQSPVLWLARERLVAAGFGKWWARLDGDLRILVPRATEFDEAAWLSYLVSAMGYLVFDKSTPLYEWGSELLRDFKHLELSHSWAFDRLDELQSLSMLWRYGRRVPYPIRDVVRLAWVGTQNDWRKALIPLCTWASNDPAHAMYELDSAAAEDHDSLPFLSTLSRLLDEALRRAEPSYPSGLIRGLVATFLAKGIAKDYSFMRRDLIRFLVSEAIDPEELVHACLVDGKYSTRSLVEHVRQDAVMRLVWRLASA